MEPAGTLDPPYKILLAEDSVKTEFGQTKQRKFGDITSYKVLLLWDMILEIKLLKLNFNNVLMNVTKTTIALDSTTVQNQRNVG